MTRVQVSAEIQHDFERILEHLQNAAADDPVARIEEIVAAFDVLASNPEIGRPTDGGLRELVIGRGRRGYVALYRYDGARDVVLVLGMRARREAGFERRN